MLARVSGGEGIEDRSDATLADIVLIALPHRRSGRIPVAGEQRELPDLLLQRHLRHQVGNELVHCRIGLRPTGRIDLDGCRSEEHTSELQSLMRISYAVFCL